MIALADGRTCTSGAISTMLYGDEAASVLMK